MTTGWLPPDGCVKADSSPVIYHGAIRITVTIQDTARFLFLRILPPKRRLDSLTLASSLSGLSPSGLGFTPAGIKPPFLSSGAKLFLGTNGLHLPEITFADEVSWSIRTCALQYKGYPGPTFVLGSAAVSKSRCCTRLEPCLLRRRRGPLSRGVILARISVFDPGLLPSGDSTQVFSRTLACGPRESLFRVILLLCFFALHHGIGRYCCRGGEPGAHPPSVGPQHGMTGGSPGPGLHIASWPPGGVVPTRGDDRCPATRGSRPPPDRSCVCLRARSLRAHPTRIARRDDPHLLMERRTLCEAARGYPNCRDGEGVEAVRPRGDRGDQGPRGLNPAPVPAGAGHEGGLGRTFG